VGGSPPGVGPMKPTSAIIDFCVIVVNFCSLPPGEGKINEFILHFTKIIIKLKNMLNSSLAMKCVLYFAESNDYVVVHVDSRNY
jgi:hypothetical protein